MKILKYFVIFALLLFFTVGIINSQISYFQANTLKAISNFIIGNKDVTSFFNSLNSVNKITANSIADSVISLVHLSPSLSALIVAGGGGGYAYLPDGTSIEFKIDSTIQIVGYSSASTYTACLKGGTGLGWAKIDSNYIKDNSISVDDLFYKFVSLRPKGGIKIDGEVVDDRVLYLGDETKIGISVDDNTIYVSGADSTLMIKNVYGYNIVNYTITSVDIDTDAVTGIKIDDSVADSLVTGLMGLQSVSGKLELEVRTGGGLTIESNGLGIPSGGITSTHLGTNSVYSDEIATDAVGSSEISSGAVGSSEIADGSISTADLGDYQINASKISPNVYYDICLYSVHTIADSTLGANADTLGILYHHPSDPWDIFMRGRFYKVSYYDSIVFAFRVKDHPDPDTDSSIRFSVNGVYVDTLTFGDDIDSDYRVAFPLTTEEENIFFDYQIEGINNGEVRPHGYMILYVGLRARLGE